MTAGSDGRAQVVRDSGIVSRNVPNTVHQLTFEQGRLTSVEGSAADGRAAVITRPVTAGGGLAPVLSYGVRRDRGRIATDLPDGCRVDECPNIEETGDGRLLHGGQWVPNAVIPLRRVDEGGKLPGTLIETGTVGRLLAASGRWAVDWTIKADWTDESRVIDLDTGKVVRKLPSRPIGLDGAKLWTLDAYGFVQAHDVRSGALLDGGYDISCRPDFVDVVGDWLRWNCPRTGGQGVYDFRTRTSTALGIDYSDPAELGNGFLAYVSQGRLLIRDLDTGTIRDTGAEGVSSQTVLAVDPATGTLAWVDGKGAIHLVGSGVPTPPLTVSDVVAPGSVDLKSSHWKPRWWLSKPAASWSLVLRHKATGKVVRTLTGGETRGLTAPSWDGKDAVGRLVANGAYTWTLTAKAADAVGADLVVSGTVSVSGAATVYRDLAGDDGIGDLLVMDTTGLVSMYRGTGTGALSARIAGTGAKFPTTSVFVPTGDLNGDRCVDVYARVGNQLRAYRPGCGKVLSASSPYTVVGSGWGTYDVLTSPGDVNGDGYADLIARQASTGDVYFYAGTAGHGMKPRVRIAAGWKLYKKLVGAGDLNGDGRGDLLGVDAAGVLWRYYGTATGGLSPRVKLGTGWGAYTSLVGVGDLSGDGRADLVARDSAGKLWRYAGAGNGLYGGRVLIGTGGWNGFKGLF